MVPTPAGEGLPLRERARASLFENPLQKSQGRAGSEKPRSSLRELGERGLAVVARALSALNVERRRRKAGGRKGAGGRTGAKGHGVVERER